jgi:FkbM family methyltransferase
MDNSEIPKFYELINQISMKLSLATRLSRFRFTSRALAQWTQGDPQSITQEYAQALQESLEPYLSPNHKFLPTPYVRRVHFPTGRFMDIALINMQSKDWYGSETFLNTCDFLIPERLGVLNLCKSYLDLGAHQLIWSIYYAKTCPENKVVSVEPSAVNVLVGAFNSLLNHALSQITIIPFAVSSNDDFSRRSDGEKMLVDFATQQIKTIPLNDCLPISFDFIKSDIEGYEYELLSDPQFCSLLRSASYSHFELHLGHLIKRGITLSNCIDVLKRAGIDGVELHTSQDMYEFLETCDPNGYHALRFPRALGLPRA